MAIIIGVWQIGINYYVIIITNCEKYPYETTGGNLSTMFGKILYTHNNLHDYTSIYLLQYNRHAIGQLL